MSELKPWPEAIKREGSYKVYKGTKYTVYDDGNSAETRYQTDLAEAALSRLHIVSPARLRNLARALKAGMPASRVAQELEAMADRVGELPPMEAG